MHCSAAVSALCGEAAKCNLHSNHANGDQCLGVSLSRAGGHDCKSWSRGAGRRQRCSGGAWSQEISWQSQQHHPLRAAVRLFRVLVRQKVFGSWGSSQQMKIVWAAQRCVQAIFCSSRDDGRKNVHDTSLVGVQVADLQARVVQRGSALRHGPATQPQERGGHTTPPVSPQRAADHLPCCFCCSSWHLAYFLIHSTLEVVSRGAPNFAAHRPSCASKELLCDWGNTDRSSSCMSPGSYRTSTGPSDRMCWQRSWERPARVRETWPLATVPRGPALWPANAPRFASTSTFFMMCMRRLHCQEQGLQRLPFLSVVCDTVWGPSVSDAGKTTLMDVLAGRKTGGLIEGDVLVQVRSLPRLWTPRHMPACCWWWSSQMMNHGTTFVLQFTSMPGCVSGHHCQSSPVWIIVQMLMLLTWQGHPKQQETFARVSGCVFTCLPSLETVCAACHPQGHV